jgi:two-component system cell cycle sensor histidine kinase/response regulator CckA
VVHGHTWLILDNKELPKQAVDSARQISQAVERATRLTRQLLTFSRRQVMQPRRLDLNEVVSNMTMMLGRILGEDINLQLSYWPHPALVLADSSMVEQVLLNLVVNARDAMPRGGRLTVKISVLHLSRAQVPAHPEARPGDFACLNVIDTGCGIPAGNLRRIFEPFFTTKEVGKGTGLGLATVYGIVKQHQGWIEVDSDLGKGADFRVYMPLYSDGAGPSPEQSKERLVRGGRETILVVEDEAPVRELVCSVLKGYGYDIMSAVSGAEAVELWREAREKVDLLLTDLVMPDRINGRELAEKLRTDRPELRVMFTSGYSADVVGKDFVLQSGLRYLQKPFDPQKLALAVRDCLDAPRGTDLVLSH